ncbi:MAG: c-type cytochrome [Brevirhabdus sp.]
MAGIVPAGYSGPVGHFGIGRTALPEEIAAWDHDVRPDGLGLPEGGMSVADGEEVYLEKCAVCHGDFGEANGRWPVLAGGQGTLEDDRPVKTIGSYWPYLSTAYDYIYRAMPFGEAGTLTADETYGIVAYLLYANDIIDDDEFVLSKENFTSIHLPNEENFIMDDRDTTEVPAFTKANVCMSDCKPTVEITAEAVIVDVTPEDEYSQAIAAAIAAKKAAMAGKPAEEAAAPAAEATTVASAEAPAEAPAAGGDAALIAKGEKAFKKCKSCHQVGEGAKNKTGPVLNGIVGHPAGAVDGFKYSKPMLAAAEGGLVWDEASLDQFLTKPKDMIKGTKMSFSGMKKEGDRAAIIAYLKTFQ